MQTLCQGARDVIIGRKDGQASSSHGFFDDRAGPDNRLSQCTLTITLPPELEAEILSMGQ